MSTLVSVKDGDNTFLRTVGTHILKYIRSNKDDHFLFESHYD